MYLGMRTVQIGVLLEENLSLGNVFAGHKVSPHNWRALDLATAVNKVGSVGVTVRRANFSALS